MRKVHRRKKPINVTSCKECEWEHSCNDRKGYCRSFMHKIDYVPKVNKEIIPEIPQIEEKSNRWIKITAFIVFLIILAYFLI